ncbi:MAG: carboxypeptidase regulatory-like domain-containing protein [bacterium]|nr:carboxypeptidase regulatory-like domain-containing protein [bacterium]
MSERRNFNYNVTSGALFINTYTTSGNHLSRVNIKIQPLQGSGENNEYSTSDSGILSLNVQPGTYQIFCSKVGFRDTVLTSEIEVNKQTEQKIYMKIVQNVISGTVVDFLNSPVSNVEIIATDLVQQNQLKIISDLTGKFQFPLSPSTYELFAWKQGYIPVDTIQVETSSNSELILSSPLRIRKNNCILFGKVTDQFGTLLYGAQITAKKNQLQFVTRTDHNGAFQLTMSSGTWQILGNKPGYSMNDSRSISFTDNQTITLSPNLILNSQAASVSGIVTDGSKAIDRVTINAVSNSARIYTTMTNAKGLFSISMPAESYTLYFHREGFIDPFPQQVELKSNQNINDLFIQLNPTLAEVSGTISNNNQPLHRAIITNGTSSDTSRYDGFYSLKLSAGTHQLNVFKTGYFQPQPKKITLISGDIKTNQNIDMSSAAAAISGKIIGNGNTIAIAKVIAIQNSDSIVTYSDYTGNFFFSIAPGIWKLIAQKEGFQENSLQNIAVQANQKLQGVDINLVPNSATIKGVITDSQGNHLTQATIICNERKLAAISTTDGNYSLSLSPGTVTLTASKSGYLSQTTNVTITNGQSQTINFLLDKLAALSGKITDTNSDPINQAEVFVFQSADTTTTYTDYNGDYQLFLSGGTYLLQADKIGYTQVQQQITIPSGNSISRNMQLQFNPGEIAQIAGLITVDQKKPLSGVQIKISGRVNKTTNSGIDGMFELKRLETGYNYQILPYHKTHFFVPNSRNYNPLNENKLQQNFVATLYGDLSDNQEVNSFDGSLVLRLAARRDISPYFTKFPRDSLAADVSGNNKISSFDASLIFRYTVGLIDFFPAQEGASSVPKIKFDEEKPLHIYIHQTVMANNVVKVTLLNSVPLEFYSMDACLHFESALLEPVSILPSKELKPFLFDWNVKNEDLFIAMAGSEKAQISDTLFSIYFQKNDNKQNINTANFILKTLELDEALIPFMSDENPNIPERFFVSQNYPNPFNQNTMFKTWIPKLDDKAKSKLQIEIYNILGQKVKTVINEEILPGYYSFHWSGDSDQHISLASGLYILQVKYSSFNEIRKMILVR